MADATGAIQRDVPSNGLEQPTETREREPSPRDAAMAAIESARAAELEKESGVKFDDPDAKVDTLADKAAEDAAAVAAGKNAADVLAASKQVDKQTDELILDAETLARAKVRVKIDGNEELVDASKALAQYQKGAAADVRLADATRLQREAAADRTEAATARAKAEATPAPKAAEPAKPAVDANKKFREAADALYRSEPEEAAALFAEAVAAATPQPVPQSAATAATPLDPEAVAQVVEQRLSQKSALTQLFKDYPEILARPDMQHLSDYYMSVNVTNGMSIPDAIAKAGEQIGETFKLGKFKDSSGRPLKGNAPTTTEQKLERKAAIDEPAANAARASETVQEPESASQLIEQMKAAREAQAQPAQHQRRAA